MRLLKENLHRWLRLLALGSILAVPALLMIWAARQGLFTPLSLIEARQNLREFVEANEIIGFLIYFLAYATAVALALPGAAILTLLGGFLFGAVLGGLIAIFAATIGASIIFLLACGILRNHFAATGEGLAKKLQTEFTNNAFHYLLFLRLVPVFPFFLVNIMPAFTAIRLRIYMLATFIGILPGTFAFAFIGAGLDGLIAAAGGAEGFKLSGLLQPELLWGFGFLGVLSLLPVIWKRKAKT